MQAFIYLRVSTPRQAEGGVSISRGDDQGVQETRCRELCQYKQWEISEPPFIDAGVSGRSTKRRDALARAVKAACEAKGVVVMYALSRLSRNARDLYNLTHELEAAGAHFATVAEDIDTSTAMGKAFFGLCAVFAQLESDVISERTKAVHAHLKAKHGVNVISRVRYGWHREKGARELVPVPEEQAVIAKALEFRRPTKKFGPPTPWETVARLLNEAGLKTRLGYCWSKGSLKRVFGKKDTPEHKAARAIEIKATGRVCPTRENCAS
jgi:DNA invertase Pin-like site-specific DNA recombinase